MVPDLAGWRRERMAELPDTAPTYAAAIAELKAEGKCPNETNHRQVKYLNNVVEAEPDHLAHSSGLQQSPPGG